MLLKRQEKHLLLSWLIKTAFLTIPSMEDIKGECRGPLKVLSRHVGGGIEENLSSLFSSMPCSPRCLECNTAPSVQNSSDYPPYFQYGN